MRLADFIETNSERILAEWVVFARTQAGAETMKLVALRDHAAEMLTAMVADLRTPQTAREQREKSFGDAPNECEDASSPAAEHGVGRAVGGFSVAEMMAEFRALRASVLRLWTAEQGELAKEDLQDMMRFNEAIDQAIAESVAQYTGAVSQSQDLFVAILGHDLRTPLQTVMLVTEQIAGTNQLDKPQAELMTRAVRSAKRMSRMIDDLLDFTRTRMGVSVAVNPQDIDLATVAREAVDELRSISPGRVFEVQLSGDLRGLWDGPRIAQVLANLLGNAVQHGDPSAPVQLAARGAPAEVTLEVRNQGTAIPHAEIAGLFGPFKRLRGGGKDDSAHHLGLGLYIADQIVAAHGGRIDVTSSAKEGTCFVARLPRQAQP